MGQGVPQKARRGLVRHLGRRAEEPSRTRTRTRGPQASRRERVLEKSRGLLREGSPVSAKYEFSDAEKADHAIVDMCAWLRVSRSGFYEWRTRPLSATAERRERLKTLIEAIFAANHETYGHRRVHAVLARSGEEASLELVRQLMRELGLQPVQPRPWRPVTTLAGDPGAIPDLVNRDFTAARPGTKLVGDITYIPTWEGFLYLATVIDCHSKMVVGWAMADHFKTSLITAALDSAAGSIRIEEGCIFHSDRGSNYTSDEFGRHLSKKYKMRRSVGRTGVCWDNAMAESFFGALKNEWLNRMVFATRAKARRAVVQYIEGFYNRHRLHSANGYRTPLEVHAQYLSRQQAA
ncbi:IS3 family transposase [Actinomadura formosensis]|uniref:IS3 family transposase n=1 Tax=Actinomadura formosensis TaxID=60706 RepID=UPI001F5E606C|nr:IS3 family transposase [Actinomadura formosensis]